MYIKEVGGVQFFFFSFFVTERDRRQHNSGAGIRPFSPPSASHEQADSQHRLLEVSSFITSAKTKIG